MRRRRGASPLELQQWGGIRRSRWTTARSIWWSTTFNEEAFVYRTMRAACEGEPLPAGAAEGEGKQPFRSRGEGGAASGDQSRIRSCAVARLSIRSITCKRLGSGARDTVEKLTVDWPTDASAPDRVAANQRITVRQADQRKTTKAPSG